MRQQDQSEGVSYLPRDTSDNPWDTFDYVGVAFVPQGYSLYHRGATCDPKGSAHNLCCKAGLPAAIEEMGPRFCSEQDLENGGNGAYYVLD